MILAPTTTHAQVCVPRRQIMHKLVTSSFSSVCPLSENVCACISVVILLVQICQLPCGKAFTATSTPNARLAVAWVSASCSGPFCRSSFWVHPSKTLPLYCVYQVCRTSILGLEETCMACRSPSSKAPPHMCVIVRVSFSLTLLQAYLADCGCKFSCVQHSCCTPDIETSGDTPVVTGIATFTCVTHVVTCMQSTGTQACRQLYFMKFDGEADECIWRLHCMPMQHHKELRRQYIAGHAIHSLLWFVCIIACASARSKNLIVYVSHAAHIPFFVNVHPMDM